MLRTSIALALASQSALAFQEEEVPFLASPDYLSQQQADALFIDSVGTSPCIFKLGDSFYDYTPFKLAIPDPEVPYYTGTPIPLSLEP